MSGLICPWEYFPGRDRGGAALLGQFVRGEIMKVTNHPKSNFPPGKFPRENCQGAVIFGVIFWDQLSGG